MDFKTKLDKLVSEESEKIAAENHRKKSFEGQQHRAFEAIRLPLTEIVEAAGSTVIKFYASESYAEVKIKGSGSSVISYEIEPNSVGKFSSTPSPAPGFVVKTETTYNNGVEYIEPTVREYVLPTSDALLDDFMRQIAQAIASNQRTLRE